MTRDEWLTSTDPTAMLAYLEGLPGSPGRGGRARQISDRKLRLFACVAFRAGVGGQFIDNAWALATAEGAADGSVRTAELAKAHAAFPKDLVAEYLLLADAADAARFVVAHLFPGHGDARGEADSMEVADALRDVVGDPFAPVTLDTPKIIPGRRMRHVGSGDEESVQSLPDWLTPEVVSLAEAAYLERSGRKCGKCRGTGKELSPVYADGDLGSTAATPAKYSPIMNSNCPDCRGAGSHPDGTLDRARLLVLSDCLEEAGCPSETECQACGGMGWTGRIDLSGRRDLSRPCPARCRFGVISHPILAQLRQDRPLYRGCFSLDLLTGRS